MTSILLVSFFFKGLIVCLIAKIKTTIYSDSIQRKLHLQLSCGETLHYKSILSVILEVLTG